MSLPSRVTRQIRRLEVAGLVRRGASPDDGRGVLASITDDGRLSVRQAMVTYGEGVRDNFLGKLSRPQIAAMGENCRRISVGLKGTLSAAKVGGSRPLRLTRGGVAERPNALALKAREANTVRGFKSLRHRRADRSVRLDERRARSRRVHVPIRQTRWVSVSRPCQPVLGGAWALAAVEPGEVGLQQEPRHRPGLADAFLDQRQRPSRSENTSTTEQSHAYAPCRSLAATSPWHRRPTRRSPRPPPLLLGDRPVAEDHRMHPRHPRPRKDTTAPTVAPLPRRSERRAARQAARPAAPV